MSYTRGFHPRRNVRRLSRGHRPSEKGRRLFREPVLRRQDCSTRRWERRVSYDESLYELFERSGAWLMTELDHLMAVHAHKLRDLGGAVPPGLTLLSESASLSIRSSCQRDGLDTFVSRRRRR